MILGITALVLERKLRRSTLISVYGLIRTVETIIVELPTGYARNRYVNNIRGLLEDRGGQLVGINQKKTRGEGISAQLFQFVRQSIIRPVQEE